MIILPAIDIIEGKPVRLYQGDYDKKEEVAESVEDTAKAFEKMGATYLHMVDLDGARLSKRVNHEVIVKVAKELSIPVEVGGGIRSMEDIQYYLENGVSRVILGTSAIEDETFLKKAVKKYGNQIAVGIDCKDGWLCQSGWTETSRQYYVYFAQKMEEIGVQTLIVTDISKDGTLQGPNLNMLKTLQENVKCNLIASGGIKSIEHIQDLKAMNIYGAITGKALYAHTLDLKEALKEVSE